MHQMRQVSHCHCRRPWSRKRSFAKRTVWPSRKGTSWVHKEKERKTGSQGKLKGEEEEARQPKLLQQQRQCWYGHLWFWTKSPHTKSSPQWSILHAAVVGLQLQNPRLYIRRRIHVYVWRTHGQTWCEHRGFLPPHLPHRIQKRSKVMSLKTFPHDFTV